MEVTDIRINKYSDGKGLQGFVSLKVKFEEGEDSFEITLNDMTLRTFTKDGKEQLGLLPPSKKRDDGKYNDYFRVQGSLWWKVVNAVRNEFRGVTDTSDDEPATTTATTNSQKSTAATNKNKPRPPAPW